MSSVISKSKTAAAKKELKPKIKNLGITIYEARTKLQWTQSQLGRMMGVNKNFVSSLEGGKQFPSIVTIQKIASAFGISIGELLSDIE